MISFSSAPIRAIRLNAVLDDDLEHDSTPILTNYGLFNVTLGPVTRGASNANTLEVTAIGQWLGIKEEAKGIWEGSSVGLSGLAYTSFKEELIDMRINLAAAGFPLDEIELSFDMCIVGIPRDEDGLWDANEGIMDDLWDHGVCMSYHTQGRTRLGCLKAKEFGFVLCPAGNRS
ncbi:hypothetical protein PRNP1_009993 [Phytophthora ramorum]